MGVHIVDVIMGGGKTESSISFILSAPHWKRFIYVTPFLDECNRICTGCIDHGFCQPLGDDRIHKSKTAELGELLRNRENIVISHALFIRSIWKYEELIKAAGYTLIQDETFSTVEEYDLSAVQASINDMVYLEKWGLVEQKDDGLICLKDTEYDGELLTPLLEVLERQDMYLHKSVYYRVFNMDIFLWFEDVYILTYLFKFSLQCCMMIAAGISFDYVGVVQDEKGYHFTENRTELEYARGLSDRIVIEHGVLNDIGNDQGSLSVSWYEREIAVEMKRLERMKKGKNTRRGRQSKDSNEERTKMMILGSHIESYFRKWGKTKDTAQFCLWTVFKLGENVVDTHSFKKRFLVFNKKASNDYRHCRYLAYCVNVFMHPNIKHYLEDSGCPINEDGYALSEMIQWIWRSAIRTPDGNIKVYIPSRRMRSLFKAWLEELAAGGHGDEDHIFVRAKEIYKLEEIKQ
jgi:hypothetical protein